MIKFPFLPAVACAALVFAISCSSFPASQSSRREAQKPLSDDTTGPVLRVAFSPQYFSPDGVTEELSIFLSVMDESPIGKWKLEIHDSQPPYLLFYHWEGNGQPPEKLNWDGRSMNGELVLSASDYPLEFTVSDTWGNTSTIESLVEVDVFTKREGDMLLIQIPSVAFRTSTETWDSQDDDIIESNHWILERMVQILDRLSDYRVFIEGHANPTVNPDDKTGSIREQTLELLPLSESLAKAIMIELVMLGIDPQRLKSYGLGGAQPLVPWEDRDNWWKNQRVEILLIR